MRYTAVRKSSEQHASYTVDTVNLSSPFYTSLGFLFFFYLYPPPGFMLSTSHLAPPLSSPSVTCLCWLCFTQTVSVCFAEHWQILLGISASTQAGAFIWSPPPTFFSMADTQTRTTPQRHSSYSPVILVWAQTSAFSCQAVSGICSLSQRCHVLQQKVRKQWRGKRMMDSFALKFWEGV